MHDGNVPIYPLAAVSMQIHTVGPVYEGPERSEPLLRNAIKVGAVAGGRWRNSLGFRRG